MFTLELWLKHETLIKIIVENRLYGILYDAHMMHPEDFKNLYAFECTNEAELSYFVSFIVSILFCSFNVYYQEKNKRATEELVAYTNEMVGKIVGAWGINSSIASF